MESFKKLSIQVGLNGLSFCVIDSVNNQIVDYDSNFYEVKQTPYLLLKELQSLLEKHNLVGKTFSEIIVIHRTNCASLVPKPLFNKQNLEDYLKFNAPAQLNEQIAYDELENLELVNVYHPFTKINEYLFELFGELRSVHSGTTLLKTFLKQSPTPGNLCFVHILNQEMEVLIVQDNKLLLYNQHQIVTKEDFLYHLLFSFEQLDIKVDEVKLRLFGSSKEEEKIFSIAKDYINDVDLINPVNPSIDISKLKKNSLDFSVLNSF